MRAEPSAILSPCYLHPRRASAGRCGRCRRPVCADCARGEHPTCPACATARGRRAWVAGAMVAAALAVGAGGWWLSSAEPPPPAASSPASAYAEALRYARLHPDDPEAWLRVAELLLEGDRLAAARDPLERALAAAPDDPAVNARLGYYEYALGRDAEALARLEHAEMLGSDDPAVASTLASIRGRMAADDAEREDRAAAVEAERHEAALAAARAERAAAEARAARATSAEAEARAEAEAHRAAAAEARDRRFEAEACTLDIERQGSTFFVPTRINGQPLRLVFDTGATGLILSHEAAVRAGVPLDPGDVLVAQTANGQAHFFLAEVAELSIAGGVMREVRTAVCRPDEPCLGDVDGLLGVRVQETLGMTLDAATSTVRFADCE